MKSSDAVVERVADPGQVEEATIQAEGVLGVRQEGGPAVVELELSPSGAEGDAAGRFGGRGPGRVEVAAPDPRFDVKAGTEGLDPHLTIEAHPDLSVRSHVGGAVVGLQRDDLGWGGEAAGQAAGDDAKQESAADSTSQGGLPPNLPGRQAACSSARARLRRGCSARPRRRSR